MVSAEDAMMALWNKPLEAVERTGDPTFAGAVDVAARSVERNETELRAALMIAFAAGTFYCTDLKLCPEITDEMVDRAATAITKATALPGEGELPPDFAPFLADANRELARTILTAALCPVADPPTDDGAEASS